MAGTGCQCIPAAGRSRRAGIARPATRPRPAPVAGVEEAGNPPCGRRKPGTPGPARPARRRSARGSGSTTAMSRSWPAGPGRPGAGPAAALARVAARRHRQLPHRRQARYRMGQLAVRDPVTLADRGAARGVAGRRRLRHGRPPPHRARRGAGRAERLLPDPGCPRATPPSRSGSPTSASTPAPRCSRPG